MQASSCPACSAEVRGDPLRCPGCGVELRKCRRGPFGTFVKWVFFAFNILMFVFIIAHFGDMPDPQEAGAGYSAIPAAMAVVMWFVGNIFLGLLLLIDSTREMSGRVHRGV